MYKIIKRTFDVILSFIGLVLLSPLLFILMILIKIDSRGPIIFKQRRTGRYKKEFNMYKFRTMHIDTPHDTPTHLLKNANNHITKIGKFLRRSSLDELPQLWNILKGDMSIIGPRPALWNQYDLINERDKYGVNSLRPGLSGWAQINGRDELDISQKAKLDGQYARAISFKMDWKCFWGTIKVIFQRDGVVEGEQ